MTALRQDALVLPLLAVAALAAHATAQEEVVEHYASGSVRERFDVDEQGRKHGNYEAYYRDGAPRERGRFAAGARNGKWVEFGRNGVARVRANYRAGKLHGRYESFFEDGEKRVAASYREGRLHGSYVEITEDDGREIRARYDDGVLHGVRKVVRGRKTISRQKWHRGLLIDLDGLNPFPRDRDELLAKMAEILAPPETPVDTSTDPLADVRAAALRRLQAYRHLCGVEHEGMSLVPEWNELCDAAAEVCRQNGGLSHTPPKPPGMDEELYQKGHLGARRSNLSAGGGMVRSVDSYMDDSDASNIDRVGHRRWCLNPAMRRTAFGQGAQGRYSAMWSMDGSGGPPKGLDAVLYPPPGHVPVGFFGAGHAWSIAPLRGGSMRPANVHIAIHELDEHWVKSGDALVLDHLGVARGGYGTGPALIFRPVGLRVRPGMRYLAEISTDGGKSVRWRYVVAFCGEE